MISPRSVANLTAAGCLAAGAILYRFSPQEYAFYPQCPFFALTHYYCPGCGATRALAELLHGHLGAALHFNAAFTLLLPFMLGYFAIVYRTALRNNQMEWPSIPAWSWKLVLTCFAAFGFARMFIRGSL
jgi:hypothetical protein